jgi:two-component system phosphate regulon sensor histidine kinase PhoR
LKKKSIGIIIGLMAFALLGVVAMQLYFLMQSYHMQSTLFDRSVNEALSNVVAKLSRQDAVNFITQKAQHDNRLAKKESDRIIEISDRENSGGKHWENNDSIRKQTHRQHKLTLLRDSLKHMLLREKQDELERTIQLHFVVTTDANGVPYGSVVPTFDNPSAATVKTNRNPPKYLVNHYTYSDPQLGNQIITERIINPIWQQEQERKQKARQVQQVKKMLQQDSLQNITAGKTNEMQKVIEEYQRSGEPLRNRVNRYWLDSLLRLELHNQGIDLLYSYEVSTFNTDSVIFSKANDVSGARPVFTARDSYQTPIFSKEVINDPGMIKLSFPEKRSHILGLMTATMATTGGLLFVLMFCFAYTIFTIIRQKKISEMKTDFINNMTHEFKTPVSTIMIASEALKDEEITADKSRIARLANIIYEENVRLGSHIERVLNVARIDRNDFKLEKKPIDVNEMISVVVDSMELKLQKCDAQVTIELDAENAVINGDELHFSNVLYNLIDNAIKYSEGVPQITIGSSNKNGQVVITVADKGIGMSRDQQVKIFEQFYRIPTGNVHNVKGFGLGLSYVNTIVKRLNGTINVRSEKDKGSEFELKFAVA